MSDEVGGKAAHLGEVANRAGLPTPRGFAVSAYACQPFLKTSGLAERIERRMANLAVLGSHSVNGVSALHTEILKQSTFRDFAELDRKSVV